MDVLGHIELDPSRTNDVKGVDFFHILENYIRESLESSSTALTRAQLHRFVLRLEEYANQRIKASPRSNDHAESKHLSRRNKFTSKLHKQGWMEKLKSKLASVSWVRSEVEENEGE